MPVQLLQHLSHARRAPQVSMICRLPICPNYILHRLPGLTGQATQVTGIDEGVVMRPVVVEKLDVVGGHTNNLLNLYTITCQYVLYVTFQLATNSTSLAGSPMPSDLQLRKSFHANLVSPK